MAAVVAVNLTLLCTTFYGMPPRLSQTYEVLNVVFTVVYVVEAVIVFFGSVSISSYILHPLKALDLVVLFVSVIDVAEAGSVPILRALRSIRAIKLTKLLAMSPELYAWVMRIVMSLKVAPVLFAVMTLFIVLCAGLATQSLGGMMCSVPSAAPLSHGATLWLSRSQTADCGAMYNNSSEAFPTDTESANSSAEGNNVALTTHVMCLLGGESSPVGIDTQTGNNYDDPRLDVPYCSRPEVMAYSTGPSRLNFNSFSRACVTAMVVVFQDQWHNVLYDTMSAGGAGYAIPLILLQYLGSFVLLNVLLAILLAGHDRETDAEVELRRQQQQQAAADRIAAAADAKKSSTSDRQRRLDLLMASWEVVDASPSGTTTGGGTAATATAVSATGGVTTMSDAFQSDVARQRRSFRLAMSSVRRAVNRVRGQCRVAVESVPFRVFMTLAILTSSAGIALEDPIGAPDTVRATSLRTLDAVVTAIYCLEMCMNAIAYGLISWTNADTYLRRDSFNVLDFVLVIVSVISTGSANLPAAGVARVLKVLNSVRPLRLVAQSRSMKLVFASVANAARPLRNVATITLVVTLSYAVIGVFLFGGTLRVCFLPSTIVTAANTVALGNSGPYAYHIWPTSGNKSNDDRLVAPGDEDSGVTIDFMRRAIATLNVPPSGLLAPFNRDPTTGVDITLNETMCNALGGLYMNNGPHFDNVAAATMSLFQVAMFAQWTWVMFRVQSAVAPGVPPTAYNVTAAWYVVIFLLAGGLLLFNLYSAALIGAYNRAKRERMALPSMRCARQQDAWLLTEKRILRRLVTHESLAESAAQTIGAASNASRARGKKAEDARRNELVMGGILVATRRFIHLNLVLDPRAKHAVMALVALNFIVEATRYFPSGPGARSAYDRVNIAFTSLFVLEMALKLFGEGRTAFFASRWNRLDFAVTAVCTVAMILQLSANSRLAALFLTFRVIRLAQYTRGALQIENLISKIRRSLVHLVSVLAVFCLVFFIFAVMGMKLFGRVQWGPINVGLDANYNFSRVDLAFMTALRVMLGEWPSLLYSTIRHGPDYDCSHQLGSCGSSQPVPQLYYALLVTLTGLVLKHLIIAGILDSFSSSALNKAETKNNATTFCQLWRQFDPELTEEISAFDVLRLVRELPPTSVLCFTRSLSQRSRISQELKFLTELRILDVRAPIPLADVVDVLCRFAFDVEAPSARDCQQAPLPPRLELESLLVELGALEKQSPPPPSDPSSSTPTTRSVRARAATSAHLVASAIATRIRSVSFLARRGDDESRQGGLLPVGADNGFFPFLPPAHPPRSVAEVKAAAIAVATKNAAMLLARGGLLRRVRKARRRLATMTIETVVEPISTSNSAVYCEGNTTPTSLLPAADGAPLATTLPTCGIAPPVVASAVQAAMPTAYCGQLGAASALHAVPSVRCAADAKFSPAPSPPPPLRLKRPPGTTIATVIDDLDAVHRALSRPLLLGVLRSNDEDRPLDHRPRMGNVAESSYVSRSRSPSLHDPADLL